MWKWLKRRPNKKYLDGIRAGQEARQQGKVKSLEDVKKELGFR